MDGLILASVWLSAIIVSGVVLWGRSYITEKGKNLATKEDIADITREIERVRHGYAEQLETLRASLDIKTSLRMAAAEKRLEVHQRAYAMWDRLFRGLYDPDIQDTLYECQEFWKQNNIYLDADSRTKFKRAVGLAQTLHHAGKALDAEKRIEFFNELEATGQAIVEGAALPSLGKDELPPRPEAPK